MTDLQALAERLERATGADTMADWLLSELDPKRSAGHYPYDYTGSLSVAVALVERVLPGWDYGAGLDGGKPFGFVRDYRIAFPSRSKWTEDGATPALALCLALCRAKLEEAERG